MQLGNFNTDSIFGGMGGAVNTTITFAFWGVLVLIAVGVIGWFTWTRIRNKVVYTHPVTFTYFNDNGTQKDRYDLMGGKFLNKNGVWDFKIKIPKQRRLKELGYTPDFSKADSDGRLCFASSGDGTVWQQYDKQLVAKEIRKDANGVEYEYSLMIKPVPMEDKLYTVNSMRNWRETVDKAKVTTFAIAIGGFIIMVIAHLISLYIQTKIKCGA